MELNLLMLLVVAVPLLVTASNYSASSLYVEISCDANNVTYELNSPFQKNLNSLLESLSTKTPENKGFYSTSCGDGSDRVYGRALCRGDITPAACKTCVANASKEITINCRQQSAAVWLEQCQIDYSYRELNSAYGGKYPDTKAERASDRVRFCTALNESFATLLQTARSSDLMFAAGEHSFSRNETLYGLVQCTRDIVRGACVSCLNDAFHDLGGCDSLKGGVVVSRTCNLRFELYRFFDMGRHKNKIGEYVAIGVCATIIVAFAGFCVFRKWRRTRERGDEENSQSRVLQDNVAPKSRIVIREEVAIFTPHDVPFTEFSIVKVATDNFSDSYKLGEGGFGTVYKGVLPDGKEIAVKRLSRRSWQGSVEFMNEIGIIAKLQHRNLVRLLSCSMQGSEKLLIYEYVTNKSLDIFLFDLEKRLLLDWNKRMNIITGIARGIVYLHEESRIKIVHRDLKPSNVLLDSDMSAKISDFGLARIFCDNQNLANTKRVVGTYGYMAPEYAMEGVFSVKSDVFSFGVMLLEIISGRKNSGFNLTQNGQTLLAYAWGLWKQGEEEELVDPILLREWCPLQQLGRCIQIGLLCVQEDAQERPTMSQVLVLLESELAALPHPNKPAYSTVRDAPPSPAAALVSSSATKNQLTVSSMMPR